MAYIPGHWSTADRTVVRPERQSTLPLLPPVPASPILAGTTAAPQPTGPGGAGIPPLGPVTERPRQPYGVDFEPPTERPDWHAFASRVSPEALAQLFHFWDTGARPQLAGELLGAGLDWYWWRPGPPDQQFDAYAHDLKELYDRAIKQSGYSVGRPFAGSRPGMGLSNTLGPWYNYGYNRRRR